MSKTFNLEEAAYNTLNWGAAHLFDSDFADKWNRCELSTDDQLRLINACINRSIEMLCIRKWWQFNRKRYDKHRIEELMDLRHHPEKIYYP